MAVTSTFIDNTKIDANQTVYTFSNHAIGTASADRYVVVGVGGRGGADKSVSSVTVGGTSLTELVELKAFVNTSALWWGNITTGTTADIVVTWDSSGRTGTGIGVYTLTGVDGTVSDTASDSDANGTDAASINLTVPAGGAVIATNKAGGLISASTWTWTGVTEDFEQTIEIDNTQTAANDEFAGAQSPLVVTVAPNQSDQKVLVGASFTAAAAGTNAQINIGDSWKAISAMQINIGDVWKPVAGAQVNIGDAWKTIF
ncbi:hypothetical protein LCGC14_2156910 [marine sediment metagenome]|uniref:Uncharacterized protein n=1 Tax=marine sediment metagenome TaxID=412755 RepID=A0A0F9G6Y6_9ZZZZ